jgi:uncharacterized protein with FMN-binding domain
MNNKSSFLQSIQRKWAGKRISNSVVTLSSAAIFAVYAAGYERTKAAADRFTAQSEERLASAPIAANYVPNAGTPGAEATEQRPGAAVAVRNEVGTLRPETNAPLVASYSNAASNDAPATAATPVESPSLALAKPAEAAPVNEPVVVAVVTPVNVPSAIEPPAPEPVPVAPPPAVRQNQYKDGTYTGWGSSRHGDIQAAVVIQDGRIASAEIAQCRTRYPCSWIAQLPGQVVSRQSPTVDYVSGATQSVNAYYGAVVEALAKAK